MATQQTNSDSSYTISDTAEIQSVFRSLIYKKIPVHAAVPETGFQYTSLVVALDDEKHQVYIDSPTNAALKRRLAATPSLDFNTVIDGVRIEFKGDALSVTELEGETVVRVALPEQITRIQRRGAFRVEVPPIHPASCSFRLPGDKPGPTLEVRDLSITGLAVTDPRGQLQVDRDTELRGCTLNLPDVGTCTVDIDVVRVETEPYPNGKPRRIIAGKFVALPFSGQQIVQRYVDHLERRRNAKRRGFE